MLERIDVALTPSAVVSGLSGSAVVVIDVLRATTTIVRALESGARAVIPCLEPDDAIAVKRRLNRENVLLGGERDSVRISGFDLDNSPSSYTPTICRDATIAFTTTNGTRAMQRVANAGARTTFCGALRNRLAIVKALESAETTHALLVCAGNEGDISLEDLLCAGAIAAAAVARNPNIALSDGARAAALAFRMTGARIVDAVASGEHAHNLAVKGFVGDILLAGELDVSDLVPLYRDGEIRPL
jgi:2-phosphosulfolactate phosphatase